MIILHQLNPVSLFLQHHNVLCWGTSPKKPSFAMLPWTRRTHDNVSTVAPYIQTWREMQLPPVTPKLLLKSLLRGCINGSRGLLN